ncbi:MAG: response regulator [Cyclobacteriaceae bacterium]
MQSKWLLFTILFTALFSVATGQQAVQGVVDLRSTDLNNEVVTLDGEWQFYWNELYTSNQLDSIVKKDFYTLPKLWNDGWTLQGDSLLSKGFGTYRLKVLLPEDVEPMLSIKHFYCAYNLYANGRLVASNGVVADREDDYTPLWVPTRIELGDISDVLILDLQVANFSHSKGGTRESILIGSKPLIDSEANLVLGYDLVLTGSLIMTGLFFLGLFFLGSRLPYVLYFSLFCLAFSYRILGADDYSLQVLYPDIDWLFTVKLEYISLFLPLIFFAGYTRTLFPLDARHGVLKSIMIASSVFVVLIIITPPSFFTRFVAPYLVLLIFSICWTAWIYLKAFRNKRTGAKFAILSSGVVFVTLLYKIFDYLGVLRETELVSFLGYVLFFFFQSFILFFLFTNTLKKARDVAEKASKSKSEFLSMMSHEIRTPMNAVIGLTNILLQDEPKPTQVEVLNTLKFSAKNLLVIINDILDFSKIEAKKIEFEIRPVNVAELLSSLHHVFQPSIKEKNLELYFDVDENMPDFIACDPTRISQILTNLISNAVKFTKKGRIAVKLDVIGSNQKEVIIKFEVSDTGIGIKKEKLTEIFGSFTQASSSTTRQFGGTGLGLAITKQLLELQGSDLFVESEEGVGSIFYFIQVFGTDFEEWDAKESNKPKEIVVDKQELMGTKILVVEDNEINIMVVIKFLKKWGVEYSIARNGQEAIDKYEEEAVDLILMDLQMPVMDGYESATQLRKNGVEVPIIALTASALLEDQDKIESAGMNDFVTKPFDPEDLKNKIAKYSQPESL